MAKNLVVVESAAKAKTIEKFLGRDYAVRACFGHVRDLEKKNLGVDVDQDFKPHYVIMPDKAEIVRSLKAEAKKADAVYLASDPDREGEAIAWHLVEAMGLKGKPIHRIDFHEITKDAILNAVKHPRAIDADRVDAQQARRILDRLVGFKLSPLLWKKVRPSLSAGRVQSVAVRLVVDRERAREAFVPIEYWSIEADLMKRAIGTPAFRAELVARAGQKVDKHDVKTGDEANAILADLQGAAWSVRDVKHSEQQRNPAAPFTTSTLQQDASRKVGFTARRTMTVAQQLYEGVPIQGGESVGLITYMRTDSVTVSETAIAEVRRLIADKYGPELVPERARVHRTRSRLAQEAHEAIRPTSVARDPESVRAFLTSEQFRLYDLIWKRFVASQMASAVFDQTTVEIDAQRPGGTAYGFRATGSVLRFKGFLTVYLEGRDDGDEADDDGRPRLPALAAGEGLDLLKLWNEQHFTQPPPRYTEATLVKSLEEHGIGRPSTYAPTLSTIRDREYVEMDERRFKPTDLGILVNDLLVGHFQNIVDVDFTANLEEKLDDIATGERPWVPVLREFYDPFQETLTRAETEIKHVNETAEVTDEVCGNCSKPMSIKLGRFGRFLSCTGYPECKTSRPLGGEGPPVEPSDEVCETCGKQMLIKTGRFGRFLSCSDYPTCKTSRPIEVKLGLTCPKCNQGDLVEKKGRSGRPFFGCNRYPACDWVAWQRPLPDPCEVCGGMLRIPLGKDKIHCMGCDGELPQRPRREAPAKLADAAKGGRRGARPAAAPGDGEVAVAARGAGRANGRTSATSRTAAKPAQPKTAKTSAGRKPAASKSTTPRTRRAS